MADDLNSNNEFRKLMDRVRRLENTQMLQNASVTEGRLRFIGGLLRVDAGGRVEIVGTLQIDGQTIATGSFEMTGSVDITGPLSVAGEWDLTGDGEVSGDVNVTGNMTVQGAGKIRVEGGSSPATLQDGKLSFDTGGEVQADVANGGARLRSGDAVVNVGDVASIRKGDNSVIVGPLGLTINAPETLLQGRLRTSGLTTAPAGTPTVPLVVSSTGLVYRGT